MCRATRTAAESLSIHRLIARSECMQGCIGKTGRCCIACHIPEADITIAARARPTELLAFPNVDEGSSVRLNYSKTLRIVWFKKRKLFLVLHRQQAGAVNIGLKPELEFRRGRSSPDLRSAGAGQRCHNSLLSRFFSQAVDDPHKIVPTNLFWVQPHIGKIRRCERIDNVALLILIQIAVRALIEI